MKSGRALRHEFPCSPMATCGHKTLSTVVEWEILGTTLRGCLARHGNRWSPDTGFGAITGHQLGHANCHGHLV